MKIYNRRLIESVDNRFYFLHSLGVTAVYQGKDNNNQLVVAHITPLKSPPNDITWYDVLKLDCDFVSAYKP